MTRPVIPEYTGTVPDRNQDPTEFSSNADAWLAYQAPLAGNYNELAEFLNKYNYADGGFFTPTSGQQYPTITEFDLNVYYQIVFPNPTDTYTYTSGSLNGVTVQNGTVLRFIQETSTYEYQQPFAGGVSQGSFDSTVDGINTSIGDIDSAIADINALAEILNAKNVLINTSFDSDTVVNQRDFDGDWSALSVGDYGYDMWFKYSTTQIAQIVEEGTYKKGVVHTITADGVVLGKITSPTSGHWEIVVPNTVNYVDMHAGDFTREWQPENEIIDSCLRMFEVIESALCARFSSSGTFNGGLQQVSVKRKLRIPSVMITSSVGPAPSPVIVDASPAVYGFIVLNPQSDWAVEQHKASDIVLDATLTSTDASQTDILN